TGALRYAHGWQASGLAASSFHAVSRACAFAPGAGIPGRCWVAGEPIWVGPPEVWAGEDRQVEAASLGIAGGFVIPVQDNAEVLGVLECFQRQPAGADQALTETLLSIGGQLGRFIRHRQAEEAVRSSEARKAAVLAAAVDAIITIDQGGTILE